MAAAVVLREFLLAAERPKQPLDAAVVAFGSALAEAPESIAPAFLGVHPQCEALVRIWPDESGKGTRWEDRASLAVFLDIMCRLVEVMDRPRAEALAQQLLRDKSPSLEKFLTWSDKPLIEFRVLTLLRAMAMISPAVARELVRVFPFQGPTFAKLANRRMKLPQPTPAADEANDDVSSTTARMAPTFQIREAYVRLTLTLAACPDRSVHRFALKDGGLVSTLFKSLDGDDPAMRAVVLDGLVKFVLENEHVDTRGRMAIFNAAAIQQLLAVLKTLETDENDIDHDEPTWRLLTRLLFADGALYRIPPSQSLQAFLIKAAPAGGPTLGPSSSTEDPTGTSSMEPSQAVVKILRTAIGTIGLNDYIRSAHARQLVAKLVAAYPGLLAEYLSILAPQLEPRPGYRWYCVASMVLALLACPLDAAVVDLDHHGSSDKYTASLLATRVLLPMACRKELSRGIQHGNNLIVYSTLGLVEAVLRRYQVLAAHLPKAVAPPELQDELRFLLPSPEALVSLLMRLCPAAEATALLYIRALTVLRLYLECLPQAMREMKVDYAKLLAWELLREEAFARPRTALHGAMVGEILRLLAVVDDSRLVFLLTTGAATTDHRSKILQLLRLYVHTSSASLRVLARVVLHRALGALQVFGIEGDHDDDTTKVRPSEEITIWLDELVTGGVETATFVERVLHELVADPFAFVELARKHTGKTNDDRSSSRLSPATIALVAAIHQWGPPRWATSEAMESSRREPIVLGFASRVLWAMLTRVDDPSDLAALICGGASESTDTEETSPSASKKRRRLAPIDWCGHNALQALQLFCQRLRTPSWTVDGSKSPSSGTPGPWKGFTEDSSRGVAIAALNPRTFVAHAGAIVQELASDEQAEMILHHYLSSQPNVDLAVLIAGHKQTRALPKALTKSLPLSVLSLNVLFHLIVSGDSSAATTQQVLGALKTRLVHEMAADDDQLPTVLEHLLFSVHFHRCFPEADGLLALVCELIVQTMVLLLQTRSVDSRVLRVLPKLQAILLSSGSSSVKLTKRSKYLATLVLCACSLAPTNDAGSTNVKSELIRVLLQRHPSPTLAAAMVGQHTAPSFRLTLLHRLLGLGCALSKATTHSPLVVKVLTSLDQCATSDVPNGTVHPRLARQLWRMLVDSTSDDAGRGALPFYSGGLHLLRMAGGGPEKDFRLAVKTSWATAWASAIVAAGTVTGDDVNQVVTLLERVKAGVRVDPDAAPADINGILLALVQRMMPMIKTADHRVLMAVAAGDGLLHTPELLSLIEDVAAACIKPLFAKTEASSERNLLVLRVFEHVATMEKPSKTVATALVPTARELKTGVALTAPQVAGLLYLLRSPHQLVCDSAVVLAFLASSALCTSQQVPTAVTEGDASDSLQALTGLQCIVARMVPNISEDDLEAAAQIVLPKFAATLKRDVTTEAVFIALVRVSAVVLPLLTTAEPQVLARLRGTFSFRALLAALTTSEHFAPSLSNGEINWTLICVVATCIRLTKAQEPQSPDADHHHVYQRELFEHLLAAYTMSLSRIDRAIRVLLDEFETHAGMRPGQYGFRFGASFSATAFKAPNGTGRHDLLEDAAWLTTGGLDPQRIRATIEHFPLDREIAVTADHRLLSLDTEAQELAADDPVVATPGPSASAVYDPSYLLPMLAHFVASSTLPEATTIQQGLLGIALRATSSDADDVRAYAYGILAHVHESLSAETGEFKPGRQVHLLLETLRNALEEPHEGVSSTITVFLNDALSILTRPGHVLYPHVNHFLLARPALDLSDVPMFYALFNSRSPQTYKQERSWLLHGMRRGVREDSDVAILIRRHVPSILLSFFGSGLADEHTQLLVAHIFDSVLRTESGATYLLTKCAFLEWLVAQFMRASTLPVSVVQALGELLEVSMKAETLWGALEAAERAAVGSAAVSCFEAFAHVVQSSEEATGRAMTDGALRLGRVALQIVRHCYECCGIATLTRIMRVVAAQDSALALACAEKIVTEPHVLAHAEFERRRFGEWAELVTLVVRVLVQTLRRRPKSAVGPIVVADLQLARHGLLPRLMAILQAAPMLRQLVLEALEAELTARALVLA